MVRLKDFDKGLLIFIFAATLGACAGGALNFNDGTWSSCTYTKPDGTFTTIPVQLSGMPVGHGQPDGTKIECVPIPAQPE